MDELILPQNVGKGAAHFGKPGLGSGGMMNFRSMSLLSACGVVLCGISASALAQSAGGVQIQGDTKINATAKNVTTMASGGSMSANDPSGSRNSAESNIGSITSGVAIQGNTDINASGTDITTYACGNNNTAESSVGALKGPTEIQGNTKVNADGKSVYTCASGDNNVARSKVGTIGGDNK